MLGSERIGTVQAPQACSRSCVASTPLPHRQDSALLYRRLHPTRVDCNPIVDWLKAQRRRYCVRLAYREPVTGVRNAITETSVLERNSVTPSRLSCMSHDSHTTHAIPRSWYPARDLPPGQPDHAMPQSLVRGLAIDVNRGALAPWYLSYVPVLCFAPQ